MKFEKTVLNILRLGSLLFTMVWLSACGGGGGENPPVTNKDVVPVPRNTLPELAVSDPNFDGEYHGGSGTCTSCHTDVSMEIPTEIQGKTRNVSIGTAWETSMMANATRDPYWHAVVASELDNFPQLEEVINDKCIVCHAPMASDLAKKTGIDLRLFDQLSDNGDAVAKQGLYSMTDENELFNHAMDGVSCSLCHQIDPGNLGTEESMSGNYVIVGSPTGDVQDRPAYGQYANPVAGYMRQQAGFVAQQGLHVGTSESCATCHNLNVHAVDPDGNALEGDDVFAEQAIYSEWKNSDYATGGPKEATCQTCHMPTVEYEVAIAQGGEKRPDFAEHTMLGPNTVMQDILKNYSDELGVTARAEEGDSDEKKAEKDQARADLRANFDVSIARNREFLKTSAEVTISAGGVIDGNLRFDVTVENKTGHRLPSGYHSRRVYLHVQVLDSSGEQIFESGRIREDGSIVGVAEDVDSSTWEPHYNRITSETQVQVYQAITGNSEGKRTNSLLASSFYLKDNRLTPAGMDKYAILKDKTLPSTFGVFGEAMNDNNFNNGADSVRYEIPVDGNDVYTVSVELRYQPLSYGHLQKLWTQGDDVDQIDMFRTMYDNTSFYDEVIDTATEVMQ